MLEIVKQTIDFYIKNLKTPYTEDINFDSEKSLLDERWCFFVTIYLKWEVRWSAGNIKEIKDNSALELIESAVSAISKDSRFSPLSLSESKDIKIRVDKIIYKEILKDKKILDLDPAISWLLVIKKDYSKTACILPNINPKLFAWEDFLPVLAEKLWEKIFVEEDYIVYEIKTETETDY